MDKRLISDEYRRLNAELHRKNKNYGITAGKHIESIRGYARQFRSNEILDYGCGKRLVAQSLGKEYLVHNYDPALEDFNAPPQPSSFVVCIDVLEHIEPNLLENVLLDLQRVTLRGAFFTIATRLAIKTLPDGTNAHKIVECYDWWVAKLKNYFNVLASDRTEDQQGLWAILERKAISSDR